MNKKIKKCLAYILTAVLIVPSVFAILQFSACSKNDTKNAAAMLSASADEVMIGTKKIQYFRYIKTDGSWKFDGLYAYNNKKPVRIFDGAGAMFRFASLQYNNENPATKLNTAIDEIEVVSDAKGYKEISVKNSQTRLTLSVADGDRFIKRSFTISNSVDNVFAGFQIAFSLRSDAEHIIGEYGGIATKDTSVSQCDIPYAFPAVVSKLSGEGFTANFVNVVDYGASDPAFSMMRRRKIDGGFDIGAGSSAYEVKAGTAVSYTDYIGLEISGADFYSMIGNAADKFYAVSPIPAEELAATENLAASDFETLTRGLSGDLRDPRAGGERLLGAMTPYAYIEEFNGGWGCMFTFAGAMKGLLKYDLYNNDAEALADTLRRLLIITEPQAGGLTWIQPYKGRNAKDGEYVLSYTYAGTFNHNTSPEETGNVPGISTWKQYDMLCNFGELALLSGSDSLRAGFLKIMPFLNALRLPDYSQPVAWDYETKTPVSGSDNGGSGGGASMWAYIHFLASQAADDKGMQKKYRDDGLKALDHANTLGFYNMLGIRVSTKATSIAWNVKANMLAYEITGKKEYIERAKHVAKSALMFYYLYTNPYTFFPSFGFGYAEFKERWESYLDMSSSLWIMMDVMEHLYDDTTLLDTYYAASKTHMYCFPINGQLYGNQTRMYDSLDAHYVPYEFPTGVLSDDPTPDGGQTGLRQIKELYGCGALFLEYLMYEAWGTCSDKSQLVLCLSANEFEANYTNHRFIIYNPTNTAKAPSFIFKNLAAGKYRVKINGHNVGTFTDTELSYGIAVTLGAKESNKVTVDIV